MNDRARFTAAAAALLACIFLLTAAAESFAQQCGTLTPDRTLRVEFQINPQFPIPPNTLNVYGGYATINQPWNRMTGRLYNGDALLGTSTSANSNPGYVGRYSFYPLGPSFESAGGPWDFPRAGEPATVDFASILNGTINGRFDLTIDAGSISFDLSKIAVTLLQASGPNYGQSTPPPATVTSVKLIPELPCDPPPPPPTVPPPPISLDDDDAVISPAQLKAACEASRNTPVVLNTSALLSSGTASINAPCTIQLGANVSLNADGANLNFNGPLIVQSQGKAALHLNKSLFGAPFVTVDLRGAGSSFKTSESTIRASAGGLSVALGDEASFEIVKSFSGQSNALQSSDRLRIVGGRKLSGTVTSANFTAPAGIELAINGDEGIFKASDVVAFNAAQGAISLTSTGAKSSVEIKDAAFRFGSSFLLRFAGRESSAKFEKSVFGPTSGLAAGGATLAVGGDAAGSGSIEATEIRFDRVGSIDLSASPSGGGSLKLFKSYLKATGSVVLKGGSILESSELQMFSNSLIGLSAAPGGICLANSNTYSAPTILACR